MKISTEQLKLLEFYIAIFVLMLATNFSILYVKKKSLGDFKYDIYNDELEKNLIFYILRILAFVFSTLYIIYSRGNKANFGIYFLVGFLALVTVSFTNKQFIKNKKKGLYENGYCTYSGIYLYKECKGYSLNRKKDKLVILFTKKIHLLNTQDEILTNYENKKDCIRFLDKKLTQIV